MMAGQESRAFHDIVAKEGASTYGAEEAETEPKVRQEEVTQEIDHREGSSKKAAAPPAPPAGDESSQGSNVPQTPPSNHLDYEKHVMSGFENFLGTKKKEDGKEESQIEDYRDAMPDFDVEDLPEAGGSVVSSSSPGDAAQALDSAPPKKKMKLQQSGV